MKTVAWFGAIDFLLEPDVIRRLRDAIGLTAVIPDDYTPHHSGFRLPEDLLERSPLAGWHARPEAADRHRRTYGLVAHAIPVFPGVVGPAYDDSKLCRLIDEAGRLGVEVWAHLGLWGYGGDIFPELALQDDLGRTLPEEDIPWGIPICPNNTEVRDWTGDCLATIARMYGVKAMDVDHGHFPPPASVGSLFGCCCPRCEAKANELGYDFAAMKASLAALRGRLPGLTAARVAGIADFSANPVDFLGLVGYDPDLLNWFRFRAASVTEHMAALTAAVHAAVGDACPVDSHLHPPAIAFLSGQDLPAWEKAVDRLTPGWGPVVGWDLAQMNTIAIWAAKLCANVAGLEESTALRALYRFFGYDDLPMPTTIAEVKAGRFPVAQVMAREIRKAAQLFSGAKPFYAPYRLWGVSLDDVRELGRVVKECSPAGFITGGQLSDEVLQAMQTAL